VEKRSFRMGVIYNLDVSTKKLTQNFISSQSHWGHHKQISNNSLSSHTIGTKQGFIIFNPSHFVEYSKRCSIFCSKIIYKNGNILFVNFGNDYKKLTVFFGSRCLQPVYVNEWVGGSITNGFLKKTSIIITHNIPKDSLILKEASKNLIPVITVEDSDYNLNKSFYSSFGNNNNKSSISIFYSILTESILKSILILHAKNHTLSI
uniref:ribosomal protein S2 n=1 Tax=Cryptomonas pyrenoidifera TaxID=233184 RepID=UPI00226CE281